MHCRDAAKPSSAKVDKASCSVNVTASAAPSQPLNKALTKLADKAKQVKIEEFLSFWKACALSIAAALEALLSKPLHLRNFHKTAEL